MRYVVLGFLCVITVIAYLQRNAMSAATKVIEADFDITPAGMGVVMGAWYWGYSLTQLPTGWLADRLGSKTALIAFTVAWSLLTALTGLTNSLIGLVIVWGLMGCAQAGIFPCATKAIGATFPLAGQAFASGALAAFMSLGAAISQWLTPRMLGWLSWQQILLIYALPGFAWAATFALAIPRLDPPRASVVAKSSPVRWSQLIADTQMQLICAQQFLRAAATSFFYTWCPRYFIEAFGVSQQEAGELASSPPLAGMFGGFCGGLFSEWLLRQTGSARVARQGLACATMFLSAACAALAFMANDKFLAAMYLCVGNFFAQACGACGYAVAITYGGKRVASVFATMNMSGNIGAGVFPLVVGWLAWLTGNWNHVMLLIAGLFAGSCLCWGILQPKGTLFNDETTDGAAAEK